jgi:mannose-1-phosphate guanylyltransferase
MPRVKRLILSPPDSPVPLVPIDPFIAAQHDDSDSDDELGADMLMEPSDTTDVDAIVLAGTHQWGDGVFERVLRGPLLPVAHAPLIMYPLQWLQEAGIERAVLCATRATSTLHDLLGDGTQMGMRLDYFEDVEPRGPAGCARDAALRGDRDTFVVIEGTIVPTLDFHAMLRAHRASGAVATVVVEFDRRRRGMVSGIRRQPAGIYVFSRSALESVPELGYQDIKEGLLSRLSASGAHVAMHEVRGLSAKVLDYSSYASVSRWLVTRAVDRPTFLPDYVREGDGMHHPSAFIHPTARIVGPVLLGDGVRVEEQCVIVGPASIGARSIIGKGSLISRSFVWDDCAIGEDAIVDSSVLADRCVVDTGEHLRSVTKLPDQFAYPRDGARVLSPMRSEPTDSARGSWGTRSESRRFAGMNALGGARRSPTDAVRFG